MISRLLPWAAAAGVAAALAVAGCGLNVQSPDLFLLTRTGQGKPLRLLVNDSGTISCNGAKAKSLADPLLIRARALAQDLADDAKAKLSIPRSRNTVAMYRIRLENGTITFPDTAASHRKELAEAELFAVQAAQQACGLSG
ncbi:MAG TPA: hypothetical protein VGI87_11345 [Solirubrobacteraceae bacterium]